MKYSRHIPGSYIQILEYEDEKREESTICVVESVGDLWAIERSGVFYGKYHVLGGVLSALDNIGPDDLKIGQLVQRAKSEKIKEVILANSATVDGQTTAHYIADQLSSTDIILSRLAQGLPIGGELDFLDDGPTWLLLRLNGGGLSSSSLTRCNLWTCFSRCSFCRNLH